MAAGDIASPSSFATTLPRRHHHRPWADLPVEILRLLLDLLWFSDLASFAAVCKSWRSAASDHPHFQALQLPWLVYFKGPTWGIFSLVGGRYRRLFEDTAYVRCLGASHGWLIMRGADDYLLNPLTNQRIRLPYTSEMLLLEEWAPYCYFFKIILSSPPTSRDCIIVATHCDVKGLMYCRPDYCSWSMFPAIDRAEHISDCIFLDGLLYCVNHCLEVIVFRFAPEPKLVNLYSPAMVNREPDHRFDNLVLSCPYLVECAGELLMVIRYLEDGNVETDHALGGPPFVCIWNAATRIEVFQLDTSAFVWVPVKRLGDWALFLGLGCSRSIAISSDSELKRNCIYFTEDSSVLSCSKAHDTDWNVFCLEDESIQRCYMSDLQSHACPPTWFMLNG